MKPNCAACPLHLKHGLEYQGKGWCPNEHTEAPILILGEAPTPMDVQKNRPFYARGGFSKKKTGGWILEAMCEDAGLVREKDYVVANTIQCNLPRINRRTKVKITKKMVTCCASTLDETITTVKPRLIVACGATAHARLVPKISGGVGQNGGRLLESERGPVLMTYLPSYFIHNPNDSELERFFDHLLKAKEFINGKQRQSRIETTVRHRTTPDRRKALVLDVETWVDEADPRAGQLRTVGTAALTKEARGEAEAERVRVRVDQYSGDPPEAGLRELVHLCGHNLPSDLYSMFCNGWLPPDWDGRVDDTMVMQSIVDENIEAALVTFAMEYNYDEHVEYHHKCVPLWKRGIDPPQSDVDTKNAGDVALTLVRYRELAQWLDGEPRLKRYYQRFLRQAIKVAARLQWTGLPVSESVLKEGVLLRKRIKYRETDIRKVAKWSKDTSIRGNLNRRELLFDTLGLPVLECTETNGDYALSRTHLEQLHDLEPHWINWESGDWVPTKLRGTSRNNHLGEWHDLKTKTWREWGDFPEPPDPKAFHVLSRYLQLSYLWKQADQLPWLENAAGDRLHPRYNIGGTGKYDSEKKPVVTGRWSAADPSPQVFAPYLKRHVVSRYPDGWIGQWDGSQMEVRIAYQYSEDPELGNIFASGQDPYLSCSEFLFGEGKAKSHRFMGKRTLLATIYGTSAGILEGELNNDLRNMGLPERVDTKQCDILIRKLRRRFATHTAWVEATQQHAKVHGFVESLTGRRRHLPLAVSNDRHALNQACNHPIQSLASDLNLLSAITLGCEFDGGVLTTLVHDSGVVDLEDLQAVTRFTRRINNIWQNLPTREYFGFELIVPVDIEVKAGRNWGQMTEVPLTGDVSCLV